MLYDSLMNIENPEKFYRYEDENVSHGVDEYGEALPGFSINIVLREYLVVKTTPKGVWITPTYYPGGKGKFVLTTAGRKRFAHPDKDGAKKDLIARKKKQVSILRAQLSSAQTAYNMALRIEIK